jgi:hypothetical protein
MLRLRRLPSLSPPPFPPLLSSLYPSQLPSLYLPPLFSSLHPSQSPTPPARKLLAATRTRVSGMPPLTPAASRTRDTDEHPRRRTLPGPETVLRAPAPAPAPTTQPLHAARGPGRSAPVLTNAAAAAASLEPARGLRPFVPGNAQPTRVLSACSSHVALSGASHVASSHAASSHVAWSGCISRGPCLEPARLRALRPDAPTRCRCDLRAMLWAMLRALLRCV